MRDDIAPEITEQTRKDARKVFVTTPEADLWATHILICASCESFNLTAPAGARREILDDGLPVAEDCHECEKQTRQYDVRALGRKQGVGQ